MPRKTKLLNTVYSKTMSKRETLAGKHDSKWGKTFKVINEIYLTVNNQSMYKIGFILHSKK